MHTCIQWLAQSLRLPLEVHPVQPYDPTAVLRENTNRVIEMSSVVRESSAGRPVVAESESNEGSAQPSGKKITDREAVEFACFVLAELGIEGLNAEIFRRASVGRGEDICPVLWKALHDILILHTKNNLRGT